MAVIDKIVKGCNKICSEEDVVPLGVVKEFSAPVFQLIEGHIPNIVTHVALRRTSDNTDVITVESAVEMFWGIVAITCEIYVSGIS